MFDTQITVCGNVLAPPEWRRTTTTNQLAASFRVASTSRRWDKINNEWIDGQSLRVRVTCWRRLAEGVVQSVKVGDPVIVMGRLYTRDWIDEQGVRRVLYELDAMSVGHDLSRGTSEFTRTRSAMSTSVIEDEEEARRIGGEDSESIPASLLNEEEDAADEDEDFDELTEDRSVLAGV